MALSERLTNIWKNRPRVMVDAVVYAKQMVKAERNATKTESAWSVVHTCTP